MVQVNLQTSVEDVLLSNFNASLNVLTDAQTDISNRIDSVVSDLSGAVFSPYQDIEDAANTISTNVDIPDFTTVSTFNDLQTLINGCEFLKNHDILSDPFNLIRNASKDLLNDLRSGISTAISTIASGLPEFSISLSMSNITKIFDSLGISELISDADALLTCLDDLGVDVSSETAALNSAMSAMKISDSGILDTDSIYTDAGISASDILNMNASVSSVQGKMNSAAESINNGIDRIKVLSLRARS